MWELIEIIKCQLLIIRNWLPLYKIFLITYLSIPAIYLTYYHYKNPKARPIISAIVLIFIWLIQIIVWAKGYESYYHT